MKTLLACAVALLGYIASAHAYNGFNYLSDIANYQYSLVCGPTYSGCDGSNGFSTDVAYADGNAALAADIGSSAWNYLTVLGYCDQSAVVDNTYQAYSVLGSAWYYLGLPDWDGSYDQESGYDQAYSDAYYITSQVQAYLDYYLGGCL